MTIRYMLVRLVGLALMLTGCNGGGGFVPGGDADTGPIGPVATCTTTEDCGDDQWCRLGMCEDGSPGDADSGVFCDCTGLQQCDTGTGDCLDAVVCTTDADCVAENVCLVGSCVEAPACRSDDECAATESCYRGPWQCAPDACDDVSAPCPAPLLCHGLGFCAPCAADADCPGTQVCSSGTCDEGASCSTSADCTFGRVCTGTSCRIPDCAADAFTANDSVSDAATITAGSHTPTVCQFERDFFRVDFTAGDGLLLHTTWDSSLGVVFANVYDLDEGEVAVIQGDAGVLTLTVESINTAGAYIEMWANSGFLIPANVVLQIFDGGACFNDLSEPTDTRLDAILVQDNPVLDEVAVTMCPQDEDWFETTVSAGASLDVFVDVFDDEDAPIVEIFEEGGAGLVLKDSSTNPAKLLSVENAGTQDQIYVLRVSAPPAQSGSSRVYVTFDAR